MFLTWRFVLFAVRVRVLLGSHTYEENIHVIFFRRVRDSDENSQNPNHTLSLLSPPPYQLTGLYHFSTKP